MKPLGLSTNRLALDLRVPATRIGEIVHERRRIIADTALRLARYFKTNPEFWLNLQNSMIWKSHDAPARFPPLSAMCVLLRLLFPKLPRGTVPKTIAKCPQLRVPKRISSHTGLSGLNPKCCSACELPVVRVGCQPGFHYVASIRKVERKRLAVLLGCYDFLGEDLHEQRG